MGIAMFIKIGPEFKFFLKDGARISMFAVKE